MTDDTGAATLEATIRCTHSGSLGMWFVHDVLGFNSRRARALLDGRISAKIVLDRHRLTRFEQAAAYWDLAFEFTPPIEVLQRELGQAVSAAARVGLRVSTLGDKIPTVRLVRQTTSLSLREALRVVDERLPFLNGLQPADAADITARFEKVGTTLERVFEGHEWITFDPHDPTRGGQQLERVSVLGRSLVRERGRLGEWEPASSEPHADDAAAELACERWLTQQRDAGRGLAREELELVNMLSPREPTLEQALREGEHIATEAAIVYADWLQARGDPRGQLASLLLAQAEHERDTEAERALRAEIRSFKQAHCNHLFGPFAQIFSRFRPGWEAGQVVSLMVSRALDELGPHMGATLERVLQLPVCAALRELQINGEWVEQANLARTLEQPALAGLRTLRLTARGRLDMTGYPWTRLSALRSLYVQSWMGSPELGELALPQLRRFSLRVGQLDRNLALAVYNADLRGVEYFYLSHRQGEDRDEELELVETLLSAPWMQSLRELSVYRNARAWTDVHYVERVLASPAAAAVERLDMHDMLLHGVAIDRIRAFGRERGIQVSV